MEKAVYTLTKKLLGQGSYGNVYLGKNNLGEKIAVKCCPLDETGIPNILETSIMATYNHPFLNRSIDIYANDRKLYIITELAVCDLSRKTRRNKENHVPDLNTLRKWCYSISQGVEYLHSNGIIHADIKASNILYYENDIVKLNDFTLAVKKREIDQKFKHNVCTCTHRPLECFLKEEWDEKLDIWSLGCTFYEIAYGQNLFPYQGLNLEKKDEKTFRNLVNERTINCLVDWGKSGINKSVDKYNLTGCDFEKFNFCEEYHDEKMKQFNDLVCSMLEIDPNLRPNIKQVLKHDFFKELEIYPYITNERTLKRIPLNSHARGMRYIEQIVRDKHVKELALKLFCASFEMNSINEQIKALTVSWIASKIITGRPLKNESLPLHIILDAERKICYHLRFALHS